MITDLSSIIRKLTGEEGGNPQHPTFWMDNRVQSSAGPIVTAGQITSLWRQNKTNGSNGAVPTAPSIPTNTTLGGVRQKSPGAGKQQWLLGMETSFTTAGVTTMYDRLFHCSGLVANTTAVQAVNGPSVTRNVSGIGNEIWLEIYTQVGGTATTISVTYINQDGNVAVTPLAVFGGTGNREEGRILRLTLAEADSGVKSIVSVKLTASTAGTGDFGVLIANSIATVLNEGSGSAGFRDFITGTPCTPEISRDACLAFIFLAANGSSAGTRGLIGLHMIDA